MIQNALSQFTDPASLLFFTEATITIGVPIAASFAAYKTRRNAGITLIGAALLATAFLCIDYNFIAPLVYRELAQLQPLIAIFIIELPLFILGLLLLIIDLFLEIFHKKKNIEVIPGQDRSFKRATHLFIKALLTMLLFSIAVLIIGQLLS